MRSARPMLAAALASLVAIGVLAPAANAASYKAKRQGLSVWILTRGHKVVELKTRYTVHCSDGKTHRFFLDLVDSTAPTSQPGGRFLWHATNISDRITARRRIQGKVRTRIVRGSIFSTLIAPAARCWSGASMNNPRVRFTARRQSAPHHGRG